VSYVIAILGLQLLVLVHEAGHFFTARAVGLRPTRFYVGFPPALVKTRRDGTEYGIGSIPLGGLVSIPGMTRPAPADLDIHLGPALREAPEIVGPLERVKAELAEGRFSNAEALLPELEAAVADASLSPKARKAADRGLADLRQNLSGNAYWRQHVPARLAIILAGPLVNIVLALALFTALFMVGGGRATRTVDSVLPESPAAHVGLRSGDRIEAVGSRPILKPTQIPERIKASRGEPIVLVVERDGQRVRLGPVRAERDTDGRYRLGFALRGEGLPFTQSVGNSFRLTGEVVKATAVGIGRLVRGQGRNEVEGPVGIVHDSSTAASEGAQPYLWVLGLISLSLGIFNLLPFLPLDGGHILLAAIEGVRGRALRRVVYERFTAIGFALLIVLAFVVLSSDIGRLGGG
jgi:regulator of sigma E protease